MIFMKSEPGHPRRGHPLVPDPAYPCHALVGVCEGHPLCGSTEMVMRVLGNTWRTTSMVPKCDRCAAVIAAQDEGQ